jgi:DNA-binding SARP family transcriptional activator
MTTLDPTAAPFVLRLFGPFEVFVDGSPLPHLRTQKGRWLRSLLAIRAGSPVARDWLAGTLWPDSLQSQALASLRRSLTDLRVALGSAADCLRSRARQPCAST